jgi:hypothetical protein
MKTRTQKKISAKTKKITTFHFSNHLDDLSIKSCLNCKQTDTIHIHKPVLMTDNKLIDELYSQPRKTEFDGVSAILDNEKYPKIFGSNIDTIYFCNVLKKHKHLFKNIKSFFELGIGGSFISKYIISKFNIKEAYLNDIEKDAIDYAVQDLDLPKITTSSMKTTMITSPFHCKKIEKNGITFFQGDGLEVLKHLFVPKRLDLLVCNPPYIPSSRKEVDLNVNSPNFWEGTRLLRYLLKNYSIYADHLVMIISSLSFINEYVIHELNKVKFKVLEQHTVPLKVFHNGKNILEDNKMIKLLQSNKKKITIQNKSFHVGLIDDPNDLWKYKHTIYFIHAYK